MATGRSNRPGDGRSGGRGVGADGAGRKDDPALNEAKALLEQLEKDLQTLARYVDDEATTLRRKGSTPKRAARLRLVAEDVSSASRLARKALKSS